MIPGVLALGSNVQFNNVRALATWRLYESYMAAQQLLPSLIRHAEGRGPDARTHAGIQNGLTF